MVSLTNKKNHISKNKISGWIFSYAFLAIPLVLFLIFYVYVNIDSFLLAFQEIRLTGEREFVGLNNFKKFWKGMTDGTQIGVSFFNSITLYLCRLFIAMPMNIAWSWALFRGFRGAQVVRVLVMIPSIISAFVFSLVFKTFAGAPFQEVMINLGAKNFPNLIDTNTTIFGTMVFYSLWVSFATGLIVYPNAMRGIDPALFESAKIDGMETMLQELYYIVLPIIFPTISTFIITGFSAIFTDSGPLMAFFMYSAPTETYTMGYFMVVQVFGQSASTRGYPLAAAGGMMLTLVMAPLTILLRNFLEKISPTEG